MKSKSAGARRAGCRGGPVSKLEGGPLRRRESFIESNAKSHLAFSHSPFPWTLKLNECHEHDIDNRMLIHVTRVQRPDPVET
jgi:hypothetical protein